MDGVSSPRVLLKTAEFHESCLAVSTVESSMT